MRSVSQSEFRQRFADAKVLEKQEGGPSALRSSDDHIVKIWQRRGGFSSDTLRPYSKRFADNCRRINERGIPAPQIKERFRIPETGEHVLVYPMLPGHALADLVTERALPAAELGRFFAELHNKGVLFRSIHLGNILQLPDGRFGLIDLTDCWFFSSPVALKFRAGNIGYAWSYRNDNRIFTPELRVSMLAAYVDAAGFSANRAARFKAHLRDAIAYYDVRREKRQAAFRQRKQKAAARQQRANK